MKRIGDIGNYYGSLRVKEMDGRYYWTITCEANGEYWDEITKHLYDELINFENKAKYENSSSRVNNLASFDG